MHRPARRLCVVFAATVVFSLLSGLAPGSAPAGVPAEAPAPARPVSVSDDGRIVAAEEPRPTGLLFRADEVPLPLTPDWTADSVRAIGGMKMADVDGDQDLDLVVGCYQQTGFPPVNEFQNLIHFNGGGVLETSASWVSSTERHTSDVRVADVNADGFVDVYFANGGSSLQPSELYFGGAGGPSTTAGWVAGDATWSVGGALADVNGDGDVDLIQANQGNTFVPLRPVQVFYGNGTTLQTLPAWVSADSAISNTVGVADLDGSSEVVVSAFAFAADGTRTVFRLPQPNVRSVDAVSVTVGGTPAFSVDRESGRIQFAAPPPAGATVQVDYVHALFPDLGFSRWVNFATCVYHNSAGTLPSVPTWTTGAVSASDRGFALSDTDADGDLDAAIGNSSNPTGLWRNDAGVLGGPVWQSDSTLFYSTQEMAWGDVDGDGDEDLATVNFGGGAVRVFLNRNGTMDETAAWTYSLSASGTAVAWGDVNGDGFLDLAAGTARGPVIVFLNTGPSGLGAPLAAGETPDRLLASPNPFLASTTIEGLAPGSGDVEIFDTLGRLVARVPAAAGTARVSWDGRDLAGNRVAAGVYLVRQGGAGEVRTGRVVRLR